MNSLKIDLNVSQSLAPAARTATANGTAIDLAKFGSAAFVVDAGLWTDGTHTFTADESDTGTGAWTTIAAADLDGTFPVIAGAADDNAVTVVGLIRSKRYVRVTSTVAGGPVTGLVSSATVVRSRPKYAGQVPGGLTV